MAYEFSFSPGGSAGGNALAAVQPLRLGEGVRFVSQTPFNFLEQKPEIVAQAAAQGQAAIADSIGKGVLSAAGQFAEAKNKELEHTRALEIAQIKANDPETIARKNYYQKLQNEALEQKVAAGRPGAVDPNDVKIQPMGSLPQIEVPLPTNPDVDVDFSQALDVAPAAPAAPGPVAPAAPAPAPGAPAAPPAPPAPTSAYVPGTPAQELQRVVDTQALVRKNFEDAQKRLVESINAIPSSIRRETVQKYFAEGDIEGLQRHASAKRIDTEALLDYMYSRDALAKLDSRVAKLQSEQEAVVAKPAPAPTQSLSLQGIAPVFDLSENPSFDLQGNLVPPAPISPSGRTVNVNSLPPSEGTAVLGGTTLDLVPISGAEGQSTPPLASATPPQVPVAPAAPAAPAAPLATAPPAAPAPSAPPAPGAPPAVPFAELPQASQQEIIARRQQDIDNFAQNMINNYALNWEGQGDAIGAAKYLNTYLGQYGYKAAVTKEKDSKGRVYYSVDVVNEEPISERPELKGMVKKSVKEKDGELETTYEPGTDPKQVKNELTGQQASLKTLIDQIDKIEKISPGWVPGAGSVSQLINLLPFATDAKTVRALIENVKGNVAFDQLRKMKAAGVSFGALSDIELGMLGATKGALDPNTNLEFFLDNLGKIKADAQKAIGLIDQELGAAPKTAKDGAIAVDGQGNQFQVIGGAWVPITK